MTDAFLPSIIQHVYISIKAFNFPALIQMLQSTNSPYSLPKDVDTVVWRQTAALLMKSGLINVPWVHTKQFRLQLVFHFTYSEVLLQ